MKRTGFSLIEVIVAVGIFATAVPAMLALIMAMNRSQRTASDAQVALGLPDAITVEVYRMAAAKGFDGLAAAVPVMSSEAENGLLLVAEREGTNVRELVSGDAQAQYFLIELRRFINGPGLVFTPGAGHLALNVRVSWPYRATSGGQLLPATSPTDRDSVLFNLAISR